MQAKYHVYETIQDAYFDVIRAFITDRDDITEGRSGLRTWSFDHTIVIRNPTADIDLGEVAFTPRRWQKFLLDYFEPRGFSEFYTKTVNGRAPQEAGYTCPVRLPHSLGNCVMGVTAHVEPPRVRMVSRTCIWAPTGLLDLSFGAALCDALRRDMGDAARDVQLVWQIGQLQMHAMKMMPVVQKHFRDLLPLFPHTPTGRLLNQQFRTMDRLATGAYKTGRRAVMKVNQIAEGTWPHPPFYPTIPDAYLYTVTTRQDNTITALEISQQTGLPLEDVYGTLKQMGLVIRNADVYYNLEDPKVIRAIQICTRRAQISQVDEDLAEEDEDVSLAAD